MSILTKEGIQKILNDDWLLMDDCEGLENCTVIKELARMALAAIDSKPVATLDVQSRRPDGNKFALVFSSAAHKLPDDVYFLYRHAQPASEREQVRQEHAEWSQATFGNVGPVGPLKHLSKEALEAAADPEDLSEWADMQFLLWDAQRRAGITDEQITQAMIDKLAVNKQREWPEPKDGEPRLHIKEQAAPVVQCPYPCGWDTLSKLAIQDAAFVSLALVAGEPATESIRQAAITNSDRLLKVISACRAATLAAAAQPQNAPQNIPEIIPGWIPVSDRMPGNGVQVLVSDVSGHVFVCHHDGSFWVDFRVGIGKRCITHWMPLPAAPQEVNHG